MFLSVMRLPHRGSAKEEKQLPMRIKHLLLKPFIFPMISASICPFSALYCWLSARLWLKRHATDCRNMRGLCLVTFFLLMQFLRSLTFVASIP